MHAWFIVRGLERRRFVDEHDRDHVLDANIRYLAVADDRGLASGHPDGHRLHLIGFEGAPLQNNFERIERSLNGRADRPFLDIGADDFVALAELIRQICGELRGIGLRRVIGQEVIRTG